MDSGASYKITGFLDDTGLDKRTRLITLYRQTEVRSCHPEFSSSGNGNVTGICGHTVALASFVARRLRFQSTYVVLLIQLCHYESIDLLTTTS
jgi:hypothetical protein